jgi:tetratricopeptide (TPR) repeat protein
MKVANLKNHPAILSLLVMLMMTWNGMAGTKPDYISVESATLRFYTEKQWDSLIITGKEALRYDIDFFYLRFRLGSAYFAKENYITASNHFRKALSFNSAEPSTQVLLYYSYLYSNRTEEARSVLREMSEESREKMSKPVPFVDRLSVEAGYTFSSDNALQNDPDLMGNDSLYGEQDLYGDNLYTGLSARFNVAAGVSLSLAYNYLKFNKTRYIQYTSIEDRLENIADSSWGRNYIYSFPLVAYDTNFSYQVNQHEAYLGVTAVLPWGLKLMPAFHMVSVGYNKVTVDQQFVTKQDTAYFTSYDSNYVMFDVVKTRYAFTSKDTVFNNYLFSLMLTKDMGIFTAGLAGSWSNLNGGTQYQVSGSLTYYPFGNLDFYGTTTATGFFARKDKRILLSQVLGAKITPWWWLEANFYYGDYTNANILNGAIIYNNSDQINFRIGARAIVMIGKHLQLSLIYQYFSKESTQMYYIRTVDPKTQEPSSKPKTTTNPYNTHSIIGGITWKL